MKRSPYLRMQVQMEIIALREFQAGHTTSSAVSTLPVHTEEIAETKARDQNSADARKGRRRRSGRQKIHVRNEER